MTISAKDQIELYDDTAGYEDETGIMFANGLSIEERKKATIFYRLFNELWGLIAVKGDPGMGKDVFGNYLQYNLKKWFPQKRILRDEKPRSLFGSYDGIFNDQVIAKDLEAMKNIAKGVKKSESAKNFDGTYSAALEKAAEDWVLNTGEILLQNSVLYLTEFWRYCYNRDPHNPMNKIMGGIFKVKRHLDLLTIGTTQLIEDLDKKTALSWIDWRVTCTRSQSNTTYFTYLVSRVKYDKRKDLLLDLPYKPFPISVDAGKPRSDMGDGKIVIKKHNYKPQTEEERIILDVIKAGAEYYEEIVNFLEDEGDMEEYEILSTLKNLCLKLPYKKPKYVIIYPCYYLIYNSKSSPQLESKIKLQD